MHHFSRWGRAERAIFLLLHFEWTSIVLSWQARAQSATSIQLSLCPTLSHHRRCRPRRISRVPSGQVSERASGLFWGWSVAWHGAGPDDRRTDSRRASLECERRGGGKGAHISHSIGRGRRRDDDDGRNTIDVSLRCVGRRGKQASYLQSREQVCPFRRGSLGR